MHRFATTFLVVVCVASAAGLPAHARTKAQHTKSKPLPTTATVVIESFQYSPDHVTIRHGGTVTFINKDGVPHTVTPDTGAHFKGSGLMESGNKAVIRFVAKGKQSYHCDFHPSMTGVVTVR